MKYSIDYPDHELAKFIGQIFTCRHELHLVYCSSIASVRKTYDDEGKPSELTFYTDGGSIYTFEENSEKLNNPDYTINGVPIGVKPHETQQAHRASCLEKVLKKIHNATDTANSTPPKPHYYKVSYKSSSWDSDLVTDQTSETLSVVAKDFEEALAIALRRLNVYLGNMVRYHGEDDPDDRGNGTFKASWFSEDAFEGGGSAIHVTIELVK